MEHLISTRPNHAFNKRRRAVVGLACVLALATGASGAFAQGAAPDPPAAASPEEGPGATPSSGSLLADASVPQRKAAANEVKLGKDAARARVFRKALGHFREAYGIVAEPSTRLLIVHVLKDLGRMGEAYSEARVLVKEADAAAIKDKRQVKTAMKARKVLVAIEQLVSFVRLSNPPPADSELWVNRRQIPVSEWAQPIAVTAGEVEIVTGDDQRVAVTAPAGGEVSVTLPPPLAAADKPGAGDKSASGSGYDGPDRFLMAISSATVGVLGLSLFGALGAVSQGQFDRLESGCDDPNFCDPSLEPVRDRGVATQTGANVSLVFGILGLAGGAGLFTWDLLDPVADDKSASAPNFRPQVVVGPTTVSLKGMF